MSYLWFGRSRSWWACSGGFRSSCLHYMHVDQWIIILIGEINTIKFKTLNLYKCACASIYAAYYTLCRVKVSAQKRVDTPSTQQIGRICLEWVRRSAWLQRRVNRSCEFLPRRASQFDPTIDKERKFISNIRWNMPVFAQIVPSVSLREQPDGKID